MKLNKHILASVLVGALATPALTSCSDFLDENLTTERNTDFFDTNEGVQSLATAIYYTFVSIILSNGHSLLQIMEQTSS